MRKFLVGYAVYKRESLVVGTVPYETKTFPNRDRIIADLKKDLNYTDQTLIITSLYEFESESDAYLFYKNNKIETNE